MFRRMQSDERPASWSHTPAESPILRALAHLPFAVVSGMAMLGVVGAAWFGVSSVRRGEYALAFGILFALLVAGGVFAVRSEPLFGNERRRPWGFDFDLSPRWVLVGSLGSLGVLLAVIVWGEPPFPVLLGLLFGAMAVPSVVVGLLTSKGELDTDAGTLTYNRREVELSALTNARRFAIGGVVFYGLSHAEGSTSFGTPRFLVVPSNTDAAVRDAVAAGAAAESREDDAETNRTVRIVAVAFGLFFLAFGGFLLTVEPNSPNPRAGGILVYAALTSGGLGLLFLLVAARR